MSNSRICALKYRGAERKFGEVNAGRISKLLCAEFALVCIQATPHLFYDFRVLLWSLMWHYLCEECLRYIMKQCCQHNKCVLSRSSKLYCCHSDIAHLRQERHNSKFLTFSGEASKNFEGLWFSVSATTTRLLSSGEFSKLRYDTTTV